jgi:hypothetical protein
MVNKRKNVGETCYCESNLINHLVFLFLLLIFLTFKKQPNFQNENKYEIPTEKKRQDLRWSIRNAMMYNNDIGK